MALKWADRVKENAANPAAGNITLGGAATGGFKAFSSFMSNGDTTYYTIIDNLGAFEVGLGTWSTGGIFARTTIYASSNSNLVVTFANPIVIWCDNPQAGMAQMDTSGRLVKTNGGAVDASLMTNIPVANATGVLPAANGGAGTVNGLMKANGSGVVSLAVSNTDYAPANIVSTSAPSGSGVAGQIWVQV